jgi:hypothetical protein
MKNLRRHVEHPVHPGGRARLSGNVPSPTVRRRAVNIQMNGFDELNEMRE